MERHRIGIVIPAFNESATIASIVSGTVQYGFPIVVDDGSTDETGILAMEAGAAVIRTAINLGYDQALNLGFAHAEKLGCEYIITIDADGQHDPTILKSFIQALDDGADVVVGTRDRRQRLAEHIFAWVASPKWGIRDPLCGIKAYRIEAYRELGYFDSYGSIGTELVIHAAKNGKSITQIAVMTRDRADASRFGWRFSANKRILRALWRGVFPRIGHGSHLSAWRTDFTLSRQPNPCKLFDSRTNHEMNMRIDTQRFFLRPLTPDDANDRYLGWLRDQTAQQFIVAAKDTPDLLSLRQYIDQKSGRPDVLFLGIFLHENGQHLGNIKYEPVNVAEGYAIMGILVGDPDWRGQGVAAEVLDASARWLKTRLGIDEIVLDVKRENCAALHAYQKAGFKIEDTNRIQYDPIQSITMVRRACNAYPVALEEIGIKKCR